MVRGPQLEACATLLRNSMVTCVRKLQSRVRIVIERHRMSMAGARTTASGLWRITDDTDVVDVCHEISDYDQSKPLGCEGTSTLAEA